MTPPEIAAITREIMGDDPNVISCDASPQGVQVRVHSFSKRSGLRQIFGYPIEYVEVPEEDS